MVYFISEEIYNDNIRICSADNLETVLEIYKTWDTEVTTAQKLNRVVARREIREVILNVMAQLINFDEDLYFSYF